MGVKAQGFISLGFSFWFGGFIDLRRAGRCNHWFPGDLANSRNADKSGLTQLPDRHGIPAVEANGNSK